MEKEFSILKIFFAITGIVSLFFSWMTTATTIIFSSNAYYTYIVWNSLGFIIDGSSDATAYYGLFYIPFIIAGVIYCVGLFLGIVSFKKEKFPLLSLVSVLIVFGAILFYLINGLMLSNVWCSSISYGPCTPQIQIELGMILALITLVLIIGEFLIYHFNTSILLIPKKKE